MAISFGMCFSVCSIAMAVKELRICPATSAHPGLPLETKVELTQNSKESYLTLRNLEVKCRLFSYFSALAHYHFRLRKKSLAESLFTFIKLLLSKGLKGFIYT